MEPIKIKVKSKQLDGSTEVADTTVNSSNQFSSQNSVEPNPNAGYTKDEADAKFSGKLYNHCILLIDSSDNSAEFNIISSKSTAFSNVEEIITEFGQNLRGTGVRFYLQSTDEEYVGVIYDVDRTYNTISVLYQKDSSKDTIHFTDIYEDNVISL